MNGLIKYPSLYQINTRVWLTELSETLGRKATLDDIPDSALDQLAENGFDWIWFLSVWTTGEKGRKVSLDNPEWKKDFEETLPDLKDEDVAGSGFAIADYHVNPDLGGDKALKRLRGGLKKRDLKLMLDFVPNHMGPDHPWVQDHPEYFISGTESDLLASPQNYKLTKNETGDIILAYGRDPYFSGWPDTIQLDYSNPATIEAMSKELLRISGQCDGVRCDMAMLVLPDIFERTWGKRAQSFWPEIIKAVRKKVSGFMFMAEVYWELEWEMQQQGFDYAYDKRLYDRLVEGHAGTVREHLFAGLDYQNKLARFLENHDEPRVASTFQTDQHKAAAVIAFLLPGLRFFHQGQFEGRKKRISPHLVRAPKETIDFDLQRFYDQLLSVLKNPVYREGQWTLLECTHAWEGNNSWDSFLAFSWIGSGSGRVLAVINYSDHTSQCYVRLPLFAFGDQSLCFKDLMSPAEYDRSGGDLATKGLFLDVPAWGYHIFEITNL